MPKHNGEKIMTVTIAPNKKQASDYFLISNEYGEPIVLIFSDELTDGMTTKDSRSEILKDINEYGYAYLRVEVVPVKEVDGE